MKADLVAPRLPSQLPLTAENSRSIRLCNTYHECRQHSHRCYGTRNNKRRWRIFVNARPIVNRRRRVAGEAGVARVRIAVRGDARASTRGISRQRRSVEGEGDLAIMWLPTSSPVTCARRRASVINRAMMLPPPVLFGDQALGFAMTKISELRSRTRNDALITVQQEFSSQVASDAEASARAPRRRGGRCCPSGIETSGSCLCSVYQKGPQRIERC